MFKKILIFACLFFFGLDYILFPSKPQIHIYIDFATTPALLQMTDIVKQPTQDKKFIFRKRFPNLNECVNLSEFNAFQIELPKSETQNNN